MLTKVKTKVSSKVRVSEELGKATIFTVGISGALVGLWATVAFCSGVIASGGLISTASNYFTAIGL